MSNKIKYTTLLIIAAGLVVIFILNSNLNVSTSPEVEPVEQFEEKDLEMIEPDQTASDDENEANEAENHEADYADAAEDPGFSSTEIPFNAYNLALANGKPIVIKFYSDT